MSLLWIIPAVWLLAAVAVVLLCGGAKRGDEALEEALEPERRRAQLNGVVILTETSSPLSAQAHRALRGQAPEPRRPDADSTDVARAITDRHTPAPVA